MLEFEDIIIKVLEEKDLEDGALSAKFEISPLPRGYGHTLGNSLRRVLLSSISGYSITSVRINDLDHEFSTIPGVLENVLDIILRLQKVRFRVSGTTSEYVVRLHAEGSKEVRAKDFEVPSEVEIVNPEFVIAHLTDKDASLNIEANLQKGVGFKVADDERRNEEPGLIPIDAVFSPVKLVDYNVIPTRKGEKTNLDKVVISIETDGTVTPQEALKEAINILKDFYDNIAKFWGTQEVAVTGKEEKKENDVSIDVLDISDNLKNTLQENGIKSIAELINLSVDDIKNMKGIGPKTAKKLVEALEKLGYSLK